MESLGFDGPCRARTGTKAGCRGGDEVTARTLRGPGRGALTSEQGRVHGGRVPLPQLRGEPEPQNRGADKGD